MLVMPDIIDIVGEEEMTLGYYENLKKADHIFLSDSRVSFCTYYLIQDNKYQFHITCKEGYGGREVLELIVHSMEHMLTIEGATVIVGFVKHKGLNRLIAVGSKGKKTCTTIDIPETGERMYIVTKEDIKEMKRCLKRYL